MLTNLARFCYHHRGYVLGGWVALLIALFVLIPGIYAALLTVLAERWLRDDAFFATAPTRVAVLPLLLWAPIAPIFVVLVVGLVAYVALRRAARGSAVLSLQVWPNLARAGLAVIFALALVDLVQDTTTIS